VQTGISVFLGLGGSAGSAIEQAKRSYNGTLSLA